MRRVRHSIKNLDWFVIYVELFLLKRKLSILFINILFFFETSSRKRFLKVNQSYAR